jgi:hypothetical protein
MSRTLAVVAVTLFCVPGAFAAEPLEEVVEQKYDVAPDVSLSVVNGDGSIRVYGGEASQVLILAIKKAYTQERLKGIVVDVKASPGNVAITTTLPQRKNALSDRSGTVDYLIVVPQTAKVTQLELTNGEIMVEGLRGGGSASAHLVNGWIAGHNCFGDLTLKVETGRLDLAYDWWENHQFAVKAFNTRGGIRASFPSDAAINLSASAPEGRIANAFDTRKTTPADVVHSVAEVLGDDAEAVIALEAQRGNIRIEKTY